MVSSLSTFQWQIVGASVQGATHLRKNLPNQDALAWLPEDGGDMPLILAISDGHGSAKSCRSQRGSRFAVHTALSALQDFLTHQPQMTNLTAIKRLSEEHLSKEIVRQWRERVVADLADEPFSDAEQTLLSTSDPFVAYGATLLSVAITPAFIMYMQLGDGDVLTVAKNGTVERPLPGDQRLFANETTSLCTPEAWGDMRWRVLPLHDTPPALIVVATDGYANSFRNEEGFLKVGTDLLELSRTEGVVYVRQHLGAWLKEASQSGSGDDITVGLIYKDELQNECSICQEQES